MSSIIASASRTFTHREHGQLGSAAWRVADGKVEFAFAPGTAPLPAFTVLPADSVAHFMHFALQSLQDAYAGATSAVEASARFAKKADAIASGTIGARASGVSEADEIAIALVRPIVKVRNPAYRTASPAERSAMCVAFIASIKDRTKLDAAIAREQSARAETASRVAALASDIGL
jgi:hypothetical protein